MCFQFLLYYPRSANIRYCASSPDFTSVGEFLKSLNKLVYL